MLVSHWHQCHSQRQRKWNVWVVCLELVTASFFPNSEGSDVPPENISFWQNRAFPYLICRYLDKLFHRRWIGCFLWHNLQDLSQKFCAEISQRRYLSMCYWSFDFLFPYLIYCFSKKRFCEQFLLITQWNSDPRYPFRL